MAELPRISNAGTISPNGGVSAPSAAGIAQVGEGMGQLEWLAHQAIREENAARIQSAGADFTLAKAKIDQDIETNPAYDSWRRDPAQYNANRTKMVEDARDQVLSQFGGSGALRDKAASELKQYFATDQVEQIKRSTVMQVENAKASRDVGIQTNLLASINSSNPIEANGHFLSALKLAKEDPSLTKGEQDLAAFKVTAQHDWMGLQKGAQDAPGSTMMTLRAPTFSTDHPWITPEQKEQLFNMAKATDSEGQTMADRGFRQAQVGKMADLDAMKQKGQPIPEGMVQAAVRGGLISEQQAKYYKPGFRPEAETLKSVQDNLIQRIRESPDDPSILNDINAATVVGTLNGGDAQKLKGQYAVARKELNSQVGQIKKDTYVQLRDLIAPLPPPGARIMRPREQADKERRYERAKQDYDALTTGVTDPVKLLQAREQIKTDWSKEGVAKAATERKEAPPVYSYPGEDPAAFHKRLSDAGLLN